MTGEPVLLRKCGEGTERMVCWFSRKGLIHSCEIRTSQEREAGTEW